jgi:hypothetical protein
LQRFEDPALACDRNEYLQGEIDDDIAAIDHRLENDLEDLARRHLRGQGSANSLRERIGVPRHRELPDHDQEPRTLVENIALAEAIDRVSQPQLGEVWIDLVALGQTIVERRRLQASAGFAGVGVVWLRHGQGVLWVVILHSARWQSRARWASTA